MDKIILVDGNNLLFRSYYATAYNGNFMKNSKGFPTNALFGFVSMMNKIITEEKPMYIMVAFDKGKTFRHDKYESYKAGRIETPEELKLQFPIAKQLLKAMGIMYYEIDNFEADDIIGTFAQFCKDDPQFEGTIISSDRDLLQLIGQDVDIKLLKQKDYIRYNEVNFEEEYGIPPIRIIDLKALMGDASDHIPGVKGIGEKTALKLLQQYHTLNGVYEHIDEISGKIKERLIDDKENAYMSYDLATIVRDVPIEIDINLIAYHEIHSKELSDFYENLEFYSFLKKEKEQTKEVKPLSVTVVHDKEEINFTKPSSVYLELMGSNYHTASIIGMGVYNEDGGYYIPFSVLKQNPCWLVEIPKYTYDLKKTYVALKWQGIELANVTFDTMMASALLDYNVKDDIAYLAKQLDYEIPFFEETYGKGNKMELPSEEKIAYDVVLKARFIYETVATFEQQLMEQNMLTLLEEVEMPLSYVLGDMEYDGVWIDHEALDTMGEEIKARLDQVNVLIYELAGQTFNVSSPSQLGEILFEKLQLPHGKKGKTGYSTAIDVLNKLKGKHPIIDAIMEHRTLSKLYSTYIEGLKNNVMGDGKIHTIYTQTLTRTGRLSSIEPNLQNIPMRQEYGRAIRKAFVPSENSVILSGDYSQIELRILAHMSKVESLIEAFKQEMDIHTKTASDIFHVAPEVVDKGMRRVAKAVNFGIIYGISSFGLSENLNISPKEAKKFIDDYLDTYPGVKAYMDETIEKAHSDGYVTTLFHRKRNLPELKNANYMIRSSAERMALNTPIQGTSADIIKIAMVKMHECFKNQNIKSKMILQVHDELVFDVVKEELDIVCHLVEEVMEHVYPFDVPLKVDIEYGENWYEAK